MRRHDSAAASGGLFDHLSAIDGLITDLGITVDR